MLSNVQAVIERFDNGSGFTNSAGDGVIAVAEVSKGGGYEELASALLTLPTADAKRVIGMLETNAMRHSLMEVLAPSLTRNGMIGRGLVRADAIFGRRDQYRAIRSVLPANTAALVAESAATAQYLRAAATVDPAVVRNIAMQRLGTHGTYAITALRASRTPAERDEVYRRAMGVALDPKQSAESRVAARYAAALAARDDDQRAVVRAIAQPAIFDADTHRYWRLGDAALATDPTARRELFDDFMQRAERADPTYQASFLAAAAQLAYSAEDCQRVFAAATHLFNNTTTASDAVRYMALRIVLATCSHAARPAYVALAEEAFRSNPVSSIAGLRRIIVEYGSPSSRADVVAGSVMALDKPDGPRGDQIWLLGIAVAERPIF